MTYAYLIMGKYDSMHDRAELQNGKAQIIGVSSLENACEAARQLCEDGVGCIELCGAFGEQGAKTIIEAVGNKIPIGYVTHLPEQDELYQQIFSKK